MEPRDADDVLERLSRVAAGCLPLDALILYGSRARGDAARGSDWDLGYLGADTLDAAGLHARIVETLGDDRVDLVDLGRASGQLRYRAARDGRALFERRPGAVERFRLTAIAYWLDMAPIIRAEYEARLARLSP